MPTARRLADALLPRRERDTLDRALAELVAPCAGSVLVVGEVSGAPAVATRAEPSELPQLAASGATFDCVVTRDVLGDGRAAARTAAALVALLAPEGRLRFVERDRGRGVGRRLAPRRPDVTDVLRNAGLTVIEVVRPGGAGLGPAYACGVARRPAGARGSSRSEVDR